MFKFYLQLCNAALSQQPSFEKNSIGICQYHGKAFTIYIILLAG